MTHSETCSTMGDWDSRNGVEPDCDCGHDDRARFEAQMRTVDIPALTEAIRVHYSMGRHGYSLAACAGAIAAEYAVLTKRKDVA